MKLNFLAMGVAALIPNILGMIWYNKNVFGSIWSKETGLTMEPEEMKKSIMKMMISSLLFAFLISVALNSITIHQMGIYSLLAHDPANIEALKSGAEVDVMLSGKAMHVMDKFRTFKHGVFHGVLAGIFLIFPIISIASIYEKRSWKYILITGGYWTLNLAIMGGIVCGWK